MTRSPGTVYYLTSAVLGLFFLVVIPSSVFASYWYASPTGSGTTCSSESPCTLDYAVNTKANAGDTVYLKNGTYTGDSGMLVITKSGSSGNIITVKAENDGQAVVDGQGARIPLNVSSRQYIDIEGIVFKNSDENVIYINSSNNINLKRVSAHNANETDGYTVVMVLSSSYCTLEDCMSYGTGRKNYSIQQSSHVTVRRCWGMATGSDTGNWEDGLTIYGSSYSIIENCVFKNTRDAGVSIIKQTYNEAADYNKIYGNVSYGQDYYGIITSAYGGTTGLVGNHFRDNVIIDVGYGFAFRTNGDAEEITIINVDDYALVTSKSDSSLPLNATLKNSSLRTGSRGLVNSDATSFNHTYNNLYDFTTNYQGTSQGTGETFTNPNYNTNSYGKGAYLMIPSALKGQGENGADMGAEVLYRYQDGTLTNDALWPWPMESRICSETGYSVTYETGYTGCASGGGIWKKLDGVYPAEISFASTSAITIVNSLKYYSVLSASSTAGFAIGDLPNYFSDLGLSSSSDIALLEVPSLLTQTLFQGQGWITPEGIPGYNSSNNFNGTSVFALNGESLTYSAIILGATSGISMSGLPSFYSQIAFESTSSLTIVNTLNYFSALAISSTGGFNIDNLPNYFSDLGLSGLSNIGLSGSISGLDSNMLLSAISEILNLGDSTTTLNLLGTSAMSFTDEPHYYSTIALSGSSGLTLVPSLYNYDGIGLSGTAGISLSELPSLFGGTSFSSTSGMTLADIADLYSSLILSNSSTFITTGIYSVELEYILASSPAMILFVEVPAIEKTISFTSTAWMPSLGIPGFNTLQTITTPSSMVMNSNIDGISIFIANVSGSLLALSPIEIMSRMNLTGASYILMNISGYIFRGGSNVYERSFSSSFKKSVTSSPAPY